MLHPPARVGESIKRDAACNVLGTEQVLKNC